MIDLDLFFDTSRDVAIATDFVKKMANSPFLSIWYSETEWYIATSMCALAAQMMPVYRVKIFVKFGPITPELTELICERLVARHSQKTGIFGRISPDLLDLFSRSLHRMRALSVQMINLDLIF